MYGCPAVVQPPASMIQPPGATELACPCVNSDTVMSDGKAWPPLDWCYPGGPTARRANWTTGLSNLGPKPLLASFSTPYSLVPSTHQPLDQSGGAPNTPRSSSMNPEPNHFQSFWKSTNFKCRPMRQPTPWACVSIFKSFHKGFQTLFQPPLSPSNTCNVRSFKWHEWLICKQVCPSW
jgi:hypothetical protein